MKYLDALPSKVRHTVELISNQFELENYEEFLDSEQNNKFLLSFLHLIHELDQKIASRLLDEKDDDEKFFLNYLGQICEILAEYLPTILREL